VLEFISLTHLFLLFLFFHLSKVPKTMAVKRLFAAIKVEPSNILKNLLLDLFSNFKSSKINWSSLENLHLTLKFLGDVETGNISDIHHVLKEQAKLFPPFEMKFSQLGYFEKNRQPSVLWLGIEQNNYLTDLADAVINALEKIGYQPEERKYSPHLTLGRIKFLQNKNQFLSFIETNKNVGNSSQQVASFNLYESILYPTGPVYKIIQKYELGVGK